MGRAGEYAWRLRRLVNNGNRSTTDGGPEPTYTPGAYYWCAIDYTGSSVRDDYQGNQSARDAVIRVQGFPTLSPLDRLLDLDGRTWRIESLFPDRDGYQLVVNAYSLDSEAP